MALVLPTIGFLISSGTQREYKEYFKLSHKRRGLYKALNIFVIRLSNLLATDISKLDIPTLNTLYINMCHDEDIIFLVKPDEDTPLYGLITLIKDSLKSSSPIEFIWDRVKFTEDRLALSFDI